MPDALPDDGPITPAPRRRAPRIAVQTLGFLIGVAALVWCATTAFSGKRNEELARLLHAPTLQLVPLFGLAALSAALNGVAFWAVARPLRRLRLIDVIAVNTAASFFAFLPFKLGAVFRVAVHRKRDGMPLRDIVAWLAAFAALSLATLLPLLGATFWRRAIDGPWALGTVGGAAALIALGMLLARLAHTNRWLRHASLGAYRIVDRPAPGVWCGMCKLTDTAVHAARFLVAAYIFGIGLSPDRALIYAGLYYLLGSASPAGMLGIREAGIVLLGLGERKEELARLVLTLSASEAATYATLVLPALAWLARKPTPPATPPPA